MKRSIRSVSSPGQEIIAISVNRGGKPLTLVLLCLSMILCSVVPTIHAQNLDTNFPPPLSVLHNFRGAAADGSGPTGQLIQDAAGNFYGSTVFGGSEGCAGLGCGTVFKLDATGNETILFRFALATGAYPVGNLVRDPQGNLYGTTAAGGGDSLHRQGGHGVIFKLDKSGKQTVLYAFQSFADGISPEGGLVRDASGNLYGTTWSGGDSDCLAIPLGHTGCGVVFKLDPTGKFTVLHTFHGADGATSGSPLLLDSAGNLYGATFQGGDLNCNDGGTGCGTIFTIDPAGSETVLYRFTDGSDGAFPQSGLIRDTDGNLYGSASGGGPFSCPIVTVGCGVVFRLSPSGDETALYSFQPAPDGNTPFSTLVRDGAGNFYGTTGDGGSGSNCVGGIGCGTVFKLDPSGNETVLHSFGGTDGSFPVAGMVSDKAGNLYGTTRQGGSYGSGVLFKITP